MATQAERSAETTDRLLRATIETLVERGYRGTSTPEICRRAGVSRGAQLHHYPTKQALVAAAVDHLVTRRLNDLAERLADAAPSGFVDLEQAAAFVWRVYTGETFYAWLELVVASRTDEDLRKLVADLDARLVARAEVLCQKFLFPYFAEKDEIAAATRLILAIFDGLATHRVLVDDDTIAMRALRAAADAGVFTPRASRRA